jgi:pyridoxal phosphate enzyme (YggS family)
MDYLTEQYRRALEAIADAADKAGRKPGDVRLVAISKTFPADNIMELYRLGQRHFGENRVQELETKAAALPGDIQWHMIGHLQSNKAAKAVALSSFIHSADSPALLSRLDRLAGELQRRPRVLLEVNISGESSKSGVDTDSAMQLASVAVLCKNLEFAGLMTMAPYQAGETELHHIFGSARELRDRMEREFSVNLPELSMGMSGDFHIAIAEGSTLVRIGSAIFGRRQP